MSQVEDKLRTVINTIAEDKFSSNFDVKIKSINTQGANFSSTLYVATIITPEENVELFAKAIDLGDSLKATSNQIFDAENFVYTTLFSAYEKIQDKHGIVDQRYVFPKHYKSSAIDGALIVVLENLASKGYTSLDRFKYFDWEYASKSVETLARYHALSFALKKDYPEVFEEVGETLRSPELGGMEWKGMADAALAALDEPDREKLSQILERFNGWDIIKDLVDPCKTSVIIHGDFRPSNLLHKEVNGEYHIIPVDYQTARFGCPAADLTYFIVIGSDQQFRHQHYHQLVDYYYEQFALTMKRFGLKPEEEYGREEFENDMKEKLPIALCIAAIGLPIVTIDPALAPNFQDGWSAPRAGELFVERFRALFNDFKQWGFI